ncbi:ankyrin repeat-containing protein BDA1-like [Syzygium oleosum]|uniref:ankyrin repeat-containing protein BDA1-like n=1 Tax=Syzygium oleosum TaxID=219896 RepID=UPI0024BA41E7|nr:ankyrin repeat-containing protein BDA1-like [Syzygium oleosum]
MDPRLLKAAQKGNVGLLNDLIRSNALILKEAALQGAGHTPLHVACVAGHSNFIRELLKLMPKLAEKVNADGFSPLHIAAARGDVETVREILKAVPPQLLCLVKGRDRRIPLHYAAANGEVSAVKELLSASSESVEETTAREETALHLSVKNNRFDTFVVLVEHLKQHNKEQVINWTDKKGDTVLHLAAAAKNFEVVDFMLSGHALKGEVMEVNALNESGLTPLDVSSHSDREIREVLMRAGAKHRQPNLPSSEIVQVDDHEGYQLVMKPAVENDHPPQKDSNQGQQSQDNERSDLLVVAGLIASATYQAVLQPITLFKKIETHTKKGFPAAILSLWGSTIGRNWTLCCFLITNTFGFFLSVLMIFHLTKKLAKRPSLKLLLMISSFMMVCSYVNCMANVPSRSLLDEQYSPLGHILILLLAILIPCALLLCTVWIQNKLDWISDRIARYPEAAKIFSPILTYLGVMDSPQTSSSCKKMIVGCKTMDLWRKKFLKRGFILDSVYSLQAIQ